MYEINEIHLSETFAIIILLSWAVSVQFSFPLEAYTKLLPFISNTLLPMLELLVRGAQSEQIWFDSIRNSGANTD